MNVLLINEAIVNISRKSTAALRLSLLLTNIVNCIIVDVGNC